MANTKKKITINALETERIVTEEDKRYKEIHIFIPLASVCCVNTLVTFVYVLFFLESDLLLGMACGFMVKICSFMLLLAGIKLQSTRGTEIIQKYKSA